MDFDNGFMFRVIRFSFNNILVKIQLFGLIKMDSGVLLKNSRYLYDLLKNAVKKSG